MKKLMILFALLFLLTACGETASYTPTPTNISPVEIAGTMMQFQLAAEATQQAVQVQMTATAQVVGVTSTYEAYQVALAVTQQARQDAQATAEQKRQDIQATQQRIDADATQEQARRDADATAVQARLDVQASQQAAGTATAFTITQTAIPPAMTLTQIANQQDILLKNNDVMLSNLAVKQQSEKNTPEWVMPYFVLIVALGAGAYYLYKQSQINAIKNEDGEVDILLLNDKFGKRAIRPRLMTGPVIELDDEITMPLLTAPAEQSRVTERAQAVDAIKNMPTATTAQAAQTFNKYFSRQPDDLPFDVIDAQDAPPAGLLDGESLKSLNKDWKEAKDAE